MINLDHVTVELPKLEDIILTCGFVKTASELEDQGRIDDNPEWSEKSYQIAVKHYGRFDRTRLIASRTAAEELGLTDLKSIFDEAVSIVDAFCEWKVTNEDVRNSETIFKVGFQSLTLDLSHWDKHLIRDFKRKLFRYYPNHYSKWLYMHGKSVHITPEIIENIKPILNRLSLGYPKVYSKPILKFNITVIEYFGSINPVNLRNLMIENKVID